MRLERGFKEFTEHAILAEHGGDGKRQTQVLLVAALLVQWTLRQFGFELGHAGAVHLHGHQIRIWKIAVVVRLFLTAEREADGFVDIPAAGLLRDTAALLRGSQSGAQSRIRSRP